jgi:hypothetical protein
MSDFDELETAHKQGQTLDQEERRQLTNIVRAIAFEGRPEAERRARAVAEGNVPYEAAQGRRTKDNEPAVAKEAKRLLDSAIEIIRICDQCRTFDKRELCEIQKQVRIEPETTEQLWMLGVYKNAVDEGNYQKAKDHCLKLRDQLHSQNVKFDFKPVMKALVDYALSHTRKSKPQDKEPSWQDIAGIA